MVEAAELAEIFQWMTPEESRLAHRDAGSKARIGEEVADVLLYLLQVADHSEIDVAQAVRSKLARNALKYPPERSIARVSPACAAMSGTHVLLDYENAQPTDAELRALVPGASQVWGFHGPHSGRHAHHVSGPDARFRGDDQEADRQLAKDGRRATSEAGPIVAFVEVVLGAGATAESVEVAMARLIKDGEVKVDSVIGASYPRFGVRSGSVVSQT